MQTKKHWKDRWRTIRENEIRSTGTYCGTPSLCCAGAWGLSPEFFGNNVLLFLSAFFLQDSLDLVSKMECPSKNNCFFCFAKKRNMFRKTHEVLVWKHIFLRILHEDSTIPSCWNNGLIFSKHQTRTEASNYPACWMARSANFFSMVRERPSLVRCQLSWEFVHPAGILKTVRSRNGHPVRTCFKTGIHFEWWWFWTKLLVLG